MISFISGALLGMGLTIGKWIAEILLIVIVVVIIAYMGDK